MGQISHMEWSSVPRPWRKAQEWRDNRAEEGANAVGNSQVFWRFHAQSKEAQNRHGRCDPLPECTFCKAILSEVTQSRHSVSLNIRSSSPLGRSGF